MTPAAAAAEVFRRALRVTVISPWRALPLQDAVIDLECASASRCTRSIYYVVVSSDLCSPLPRFLSG